MVNLKYSDPTFYSRGVRAIRQGEAVSVEEIPRAAAERFKSAVELSRRIFVSGSTTAEGTRRGVLDRVKLLLMCLPKAVSVSLLFMLYVTAAHRDLDLEYLETQEGVTVRFHFRPV